MNSNFSFIYSICNNRCEEIWYKSDVKVVEKRIEQIFISSEVVHLVMNVDEYKKALKLKSYTIEYYKGSSNAVSAFTGLL